MQYGEVWNLIFSNFQVCISMEKEKRIWEFFCFQTIASILFSKIRMSKNKLKIQAECFSWSLEQATSAAKISTPV